jgi:hypothetical protein
MRTKSNLAISFLDHTVPLLGEFTSSQPMGYESIATNGGDISNLKSKNHWVRYRGKAVRIGECSSTDLPFGYLE